METVQPGAVKLVLWGHWMYLNFKHPVTSGTRFHCTRLCVLNEVQFIQNTILLIGTTGCTCKFTWSSMFRSAMVAVVHANIPPRKMLLRPVFRPLLSSRTVKSSFRVGIVNLKVYREFDTETEGQWTTCSLSEKKNHKKRAKKVLLEGKIGTVILQIFGVDLFSVFSVVDGFTEIKKTPKCKKHIEWTRQHPRIPKFKLHPTLRDGSPPKF